MRAARFRPGSELELVPIEVPAGGAAFHDGWTFHGSPPNERADAQRRSIISHMISTDTRWNPVHPHPIYSRYRRPGETELDEAFFPVLWRDGYRTPWLSDYAPSGSSSLIRRDRERRRRWLGSAAMSSPAVRKGLVAVAGLLLAIGVAVVVLVLVGSGSTRHHRPVVVHVAAPPPPPHRHHRRLASEAARPSRVPPTSPGRCMATTWRAPASSRTAPSSTRRCTSGGGSTTARCSSSRP